MLDGRKTHKKDRQHPRGFSNTKEKHRTPETGERPMKPEQKLEQLESRVEQLEKELKEQKGGKQPDSKVRVWGADGGPASAVIAKLIQKVQKRSTGKGMDTNEVQEYLTEEGHQLRRKAVINIMRQLGNGHPKLKFKNGSGNIPAKVMRPAVNR